MRAEILAKFRTDRRVPLWPTVRSNRTIAQLQSAAAEIARESQRKAVATAARQRAKKLVSMAADPARNLRKTEQLVAERTTAAYSQVGELLADLREALSEGDRSNVTEMQAQKLRTANPQLRRLLTELNRRGFVQK